MSRSLEFETAPLWTMLRGIAGFQKAVNFYPPYIGAGIRMKEMAEDLSYIITEMDLNFFNTNYVGSHFGGSLYAMCDPFYMFLLIERLGKDYIVWDKSARIDFLKPGRGRVEARFEITQTVLEQIKEAVAQKRHTDWDFETQITDEQNNIIAKVYKTLYIRRKKK